MSQPDQQASAKVEGQTPGATPRVSSAATGDQPEQIKAQQAPAKQDARDRVAELEAELAEARTEAAGQDTTRVKVEPPHSQFTHAHITVGTEFTPVPTQAMSALTSAAADAGVTLTVEE